MTCPNSELAWAAGFFDGEGNARTYSRKGLNTTSIRLAVHQIDRQVLDRFRKAVGEVGTINGPYQSPQPNRKPVFQWQVQGKLAKQVAMLLLPYLSPVKKEQCLTAIAVYDERILLRPWGSRK